MIARLGRAADLDVRVTIGVRGVLYLAARETSSTLIARAGRKEGIGWSAPLAVQVRGAVAVRHEAVAGAVSLKRMHS